ncbi:MAG: hypothetical protein QW165_00510 [Candidatus Woesearchaeota archaeon]
MHPIEVIAAFGAVFILVKILLVLLARNTMFSFANSMIDSANLLRWAYLALALLLGYFVVQSVGIVVLFAAGIVGALAFDFILLKYKKTMKVMLKEAFETTDLFGYAFFAIIAIWVLWTLFG